MGKLKSVIVLPFRATIKPFDIFCRVPEDDYDTHFALKYQKTMKLIQDMRLINTELCTIIDIETKSPIQINNNEPLYQENLVYIVNDYILPKLNWFLLVLKKCEPRSLITGVFRNVGEVDLVIYNIKIGNNIVLARASPTFLSTQGILIDVINFKESLHIEKEWEILIKAVDLINHGYYLEAFIVAFSLLDDKIQEFLSDNMSNLNRQEAKKLIRQIEKHRLITFLGPLMKLIIGISALKTNENMISDIRWLNEKRNNIMHSGSKCTRLDAKRAMKIVLDLLRFLNKNGAKYSLPKKFEYWSLDR